jgi:hypothetical protein
MTKGHFKVFTIAVFLLTAGIIGAIVFIPGDFFSQAEREIQQTRVVIPQTMGAGGAPNIPGRSDESQPLLIDLDEGESAVAVLTRDFDGDSFEKQVIAYRKPQEIDTPIYITYAEYDEKKRAYARKWNAPTAVTRSGTLLLYTEDLIGDGGICILVSGMNGAGEQTLTVFRKNDDPTAEPFNKIAEFLIEGSIAIEETYRGGRQPRGTSLFIATYGRNYESDNIMDQIEVTYRFNPINGLYEQSRMVKIPGIQIEQRKLRELLQGNSGEFTEFINGLWYQGEGADRKYVFFNTTAKQLIFYFNKSEEVFSWQDSTPISYGLHINSKNVSLTKLRRTVNVELTSLETIRLRVYQDIYLRSGPNTIWDGTYQRLQKTETLSGLSKSVPYQEETYTGAGGQLIFHQDGSYELHPLSGPSEISRHGQYVFFTVGKEKLLELRSPDKSSKETVRETFKISHTGSHDVILTKVRISTRGIQDLHEPPIELSRVNTGFTPPNGG